MKKFQHLFGTALLLGTLGVGFNELTTHRPETRAYASATIPKSYRGYWYEKPQYTWQERHTRKNMAIPAIKLAVHSKYVSWRYTGYLPKAPGVKYSHKLYRMHLIKYDRKGHQADLGGRGPFRSYNILTKSHGRLYLGYQGGQFTLKKLK
ncbi:hypothetical protein [Secundilactobacillus folii]|uniref:Uncharacterized protein n=1 Tax=Secundilactobacillus folii TaxID=2678357 RepID=A0A7X2XYG7_9LACO|nr:hypothetical protein [Secundilactobacillus folii]MTV82656.1 hypothetical protein [Secundilactobacillus folii]